MNFEKYHFNLRVNACGCQVHLCLISHHCDTENILQLYNLTDLTNIIIQDGKSTEKPPETMQQQREKTHALSHVSVSW